MTEVSTRILMIELISIHIPKTAGSSFFQLLKKVYGKEYVMKINVPEPDMDFHSVRDTGQAKVIHGHIRVSQLEDVIREDDPRIITWLRNPVDRVISNYYFSMQRIREGKAVERKSNTMAYSLPEYAALDENRNKASWFLEGISLEELFFVGLYEEFMSDTGRLGKMLGWGGNQKIPHRKSSSSFIENNDCTTQFRDINAEMKKEIATLNSIDVALYEEALRLRNKT